MPISIFKAEEPIKYFGFGTNKDRDMMEHMIGKKGIKGEPGRLIGYEICIQKTHQFRTEIPITTPWNKSPKELIMKTWGKDFEMYVSRPNPLGIAYGTIWDLTLAELEIVREWEMVEYGAQEDAWGIAIADDGTLYETITQSFMRPPIDIDRVVTGKDYDPYIWSKQAMLDHADKIYKEFSERKSERRLFD
jgi:hypothetical protein